MLYVDHVTCFCRLWQSLENVKLDSPAALCWAWGLAGRVPHCILLQSTASDKAVQTHWVILIMVSYCLLFARPDGTTLLMVSINVLCLLFMQTQLEMHRQPGCIQLPIPAAARCICRH